MARPSSVVANWKPRLEAWLNGHESAYQAQPGPARVATLPMTSDGMVNATAVANALGCPKAYLYDYAELQSLLDLFAEGQGLLPCGTRTQSVADEAVKKRIVAIAKTAKADAQSAIESRAALQAALERIGAQERELTELRLQNRSLCEQISLMDQGISVRVR